MLTNAREPSIPASMKAVRARLLIISANIRSANGNQDNAVTRLENMSSVNFLVPWLNHKQC